MSPVELEEVLGLSVQQRDEDAHFDFDDEGDDGLYTGDEDEELDDDDTDGADEIDEQDEFEEE